MEVKPPLDIIKFASIENENFLVSIANYKEEFVLISHVQGLYEAALAHREISENEVVFFHLLAFIHYHLLFSNVCLMRCHLSEAFASARAAIDAGLIGAVIIADRSKQEQYAKREYPFDGQLARYFNNLAQAKKPLPHPLIPALQKLYKDISTFASHADIGSFVHRTSIDRLNPEQDFVTIEYFQIAKNKTERKIHALSLLQVYVILLDIFSAFFVDEQKILPIEWINKVKQLGAYIEQQIKALRIELAAQQEQANT